MPVSQSFVIVTDLLALVSQSFALVTDLLAIASQSFAILFYLFTMPFVLVSFLF